jgi:hypothetical protein
VTSLLADRERAHLAILANVNEDEVERIIAAAADERIVVVLPAFQVAGDVDGWEAFAYEGQAKAAHLAETGAYRALCGAPRPSTSTTPESRTRLCVGCESRLRAMTQNPSAARAYTRGEAPRPLSASPVPAAGRKAPVAIEEPAPPRRTGRPTPATAAPLLPPPPPEPAAPSLFG